jgi:hypothetical protein
MLPLGLLLRAIADKTIDNRFLSWTKNGKLLMKRVKEANLLLWLLICMEGIIGNFSLIILIISIPIYFIWHI